MDSSKGSYLEPISKSNSNTDLGYIINPKSKRPVKIGSRLYESLIYKGVVNFDKKVKKKSVFKLKNESLNKNFEEEDKPIVVPRKLKKQHWIQLISRVMYTVINDDVEIFKLQNMSVTEIRKYIENMILNL
jgi:hypothetical protein